MSEYVKLANGAADKYLTALAESQEQFLKSVTTFNAMLPKVAPVAPVTPAFTPAFAAELPTVKEVMEANFAFASKLLNQQKDFAEKLVAAGSAS